MLLNITSGKNGIARKQHSRCFASSHDFTPVEWVSESVCLFVSLERSWANWYLILFIDLVRIYYSLSNFLALFLLLLRSIGAISFFFPMLKGSLMELWGKMPVAIIVSSWLAGLWDLLSAIASSSWWLEPLKLVAVYFFSYSSSSSGSEVALQIWIAS